MIYNLLIKLLMIRFPVLKLDLFLFPKETKSKSVKYFLERIFLIPALILIPLFLYRCVSNFRYSQRKNNTPVMFFDVTDLYYFKSKHIGLGRVITSVYEHLLKIGPGYELTPIVYHFSARKNLFSVVDLPSMKITKTIPRPKKGDIYLNLGITFRYAPVMHLKLFNQLFPKGIVRCVYMIHDLIPIEDPQTFPFLIPTLFKLWIAACIKQADLILSISKTTHNKLTSYVSQHAIKTSARFDFVLLGSDLQKTNKHLTVGSSVARNKPGHTKLLQFLHVSTLEPRKGHKQLIEAFDIIWKKHTDISLVLVGGSGWKNKQLLNQIQSHQFYGTKLLWFSDIPDQDLKAMYLKSSALIHPSEAEGFGLSIVEAQNLNKPIICRDIPIFREIAKGSGVTFFKTKSASELADILDKWIEQKEYLKAINNEVRDWHKSTQHLLDLLKNTYTPPNDV